jgi:hypothetical protein
MICAADGCTKDAWRIYCSKSCAARTNARKRGHAFFVALGVKGRAAIRQRGVTALRRSDALLMAAGRFQEAARAIYDRGYSSGYVAGRNGTRQLPARKAIA